MKRLLSVTLAVLVSLVPILATPVPSVAVTPHGAGVTVPVSGTVKSGGTALGSFTIHEFVRDTTNTSSIGVAARGTLTLAVTANNATQMVTTQATMPVEAVSGATANSGISIQQLGTCEILDLTLGPLDLNLLGLEIHLDEVHLLIEANPAGGLLGQLLCSIANLLNPGGPLGNLITLLNALNQLLALLGGL